MIVGVPKETKEHEYRVALLPVGVEELTRAGQRVLVKQQLAGQLVFTYFHFGSVEAGAGVERGNVVVLGGVVVGSNAAKMAAGLGMPGAIGRTNTRALCDATLPYVQRLARCGLDTAIEGMPELTSAVNVQRGAVTHPAVAETFGLRHTPFAPTPTRRQV